MKKIAYNILLAGLASTLAAHAQTNATPDGQPVDTNNPSNIVIVATTNNVVTETTNQIPPTVVITNATVILEAATNGVPVAGSPAPAAEAGIGIPLIQFSDTALTVAIESLARRAGINYMLDPKIGFGQPDANGQVRVDPTLSIRWENISAENALLALLDNYNLQLIRDKKTTIDRITLKDPLALPVLITRVVQLKYASTSNMTEAAQSVLTDKRSKVLPDSRTSQLIVVATDPEQQSVDTLMNNLDKPTRQVLIETRLVEINSTPKTQKGIDWSGTLQAQNVSFGNGNLTGSSVSTTPGASPGTDGAGVALPATGQSTVSTLTTAIGNGGFNYNTLSGMMPEIGFLNADGLHAVLSFINSSSDAQIVSTPRVVTLDNEMANIEVTRGYPVFNVSAGSANNSGGSSVAYTNVGTKLKVTPRISANDNIWLKVMPEVSSFFGNFSQSVGGGVGANGQSAPQVLTAPVFDIRTITTQVIIPNGNTLVMGGLVRDNPRSDTTKVPLLGDIPYLGHAFRSESKSTDKENLIIFITPTIVKDTDFQTHSSDFLNSQPYAKRPVLMKTDSMWDSSEPHDWSNPKKKSPSTDSQ